MDSRLRQRATPISSSSRRYRSQDVPVKGKTKAGRLEEPSSFVEFLSMLAGWLFLPITYPLSHLIALLTSPLTISLTLRAFLLIILLLSSGLMSLVAVGTFWWSWAGGGRVEVEGWLIYGSKSNPTPHSTIPLPYSLFPSDVRYDVEIELDLTRPIYGKEIHGEKGNFMISLDLLSEKTNEPVVAISQPCLVAVPLPPSSWYSYFIPTLPSPSRILFAPLSLLPLPTSRHSHPRHLPASPLVLRLTRPMLTGVMMRGGENSVGAVRVLVGREDGGGREIGTGGWVVVRFLPRATGLRWLLTIHPLIPFLILPPLALILTVSSSLITFLLITFCFRSAPASNPARSKPADRGEKKDESWSSSNGSSPVIVQKRSSIPQVILHHPTPPHAELSRLAQQAQSISSGTESEDLMATSRGRVSGRLGESETETGDETETPAVSAVNSGEETATETETETGSGVTISGTGSGAESAS